MSLLEVAVADKWIIVAYIDRRRVRLGFPGLYTVYSVPFSLAPNLKVGRSRTYHIHYMFDYGCSLASQSNC